MTGDEPPIFDLVGIGFGPSNLALAIAVSEHNLALGEDNGRVGAVTAHFLERQPRFGWHRGMLIDDATMQVSFLKDLVTLRNPTSDSSFLCYLRDRGRLVDFVNHKNLFPLRVEFHDYLEWAAARVDDVVSYDTPVADIRPVAGGEFFDVTTRDGAVYRARNLILGTGLEARLPEGVELSPRIWHNRDLLTNVETLAGTPKRFVVVGAGQSAAETSAYLHRRFPDAEVCAVFARYGYSPADDSAFANRIFDPDAVDDYFNAPEQVKRQLMAYHGNTNYAVVDLDLIEDLYRRTYQEKVLGVERLRLFNVSHLAGVTESPVGVRVDIRSQLTGDTTTLDADVLVYATGYTPSDPVRRFDGLGRHCVRDGRGRLDVGRDYRLATSAEIRGGVYLQGGTEHTHGITSSLLSNTAVRVGEILQSILVPARHYAASST